MSIFRSSFSKNNTIIQSNFTNCSQNPVGEVSYGTPQNLKTRIIFKADLNNLYSMLVANGVSEQSIVSHKLVLRNTIAETPNLLGKKSYSETLERTSSFELELFTLVEDWDEGAGYDLVYQDQNIIQLGIVTGASNWYQCKTNTPWATPGAYNEVSGATGTTGTSVVLGVQAFPKGNEDFEMDVTEYVNGILYSGVTDYGLGIKFTDFYEAIDTEYRQAVAFHLKNTHTVFEPYIETTISDSIRDDRKYFYMDKVNELYLYSSTGDVDISSVSIVDYTGEEIEVLTGTSIVRVKKGVYKIEYIVNSSIYPDAVIFNDKWTLTQNGKIKTISQDFYLISADKYYSFDLSDSLNPDNFYFSYFGIKSGEQIRRGDVRKVQILTKQLYGTQDDNLPLNLSYRLYMKQGGKSQVDLIPFTPVDRTVRGFEFNVDTSWLIPQDYFLELKLESGGTFATKSPIGFSIANDDIFQS